MSTRTPAQVPGSQAGAWQLLSGSPGYLIQRAGRLIHRRAEQVLAGQDLRPAHVYVLSVLSADRPASQAEVAAQLGLDRTTMMDIAGELAALGLVRAERDPADRRRTALVVTGAGLRARAQALDRLSAMEDELLAALSGDERRQLHGLLLRAFARALPPGPAELPAPEQAASGALRTGRGQ